MGRPIKLDEMPEIPARKYSAAFSYKSSSSSLTKYRLYGRKLTHLREEKMKKKRRLHSRKMKIKYVYKSQVIFFFFGKKIVFFL